jgi:CBS domain protein
MSIADTLWKIFYISILLVLSGFFSGTEIAYLSADRLRLKLDSKRGGIIGRTLDMLYRRPDRFITTLLVGNNIVLVIYGMVMTQLFAPILTPISNNAVFQITVNSLLSTFIIVIFGEYLPKARNRMNPNQQMFRKALPSGFFHILLYPITLFSTGLSKLFMLLLPKEDVPGIEEHPKLTTLDLDNYLNTSQSGEGASDLDTEVKIIKNAIDFSTTQVRDCMIPRNEIVGCEISTDADTLTSLFISTGLTKVIVYRENIDNVLGYIHSTEMFKGTNWQDQVRTVVFVPESMNGQKLMGILMQRKKSIAIVIDELGGTSGLITLEDLVEEIFGNIEDEHDQNKIISKHNPDGSYTFSGRLEIDDANEQWGLSLPSSDEYITIAGFIINYLERIPMSGEQIIIDKLHFDIIKSTDTRIELVKLWVAS